MSRFYGCTVSSSRLLLLRRAICYLGDLNQRIGIATAGGEGHPGAVFTPPPAPSLSHHSNNKTHVLPTFQVHNLLTGTLLLSTFMYKKVANLKKTLKMRFYKNKIKIQ